MKKILFATLLLFCLIITGCTKSYADDYQENARYTIINETNYYYGTYDDELTNIFEEQKEKILSLKEQYPYLWWARLEFMDIVYLEEYQSYLTQGDYSISLNRIVIFSKDGLEQTVLKMLAKSLVTTQYSISNSLNICLANELLKPYNLKLENSNYQVQNIFNIMKNIFGIDDVFRFSMSDQLEQVINKNSKNQYYAKLKSVIQDMYVCTTHAQRLELAKIYEEILFTVAKNYTKDYEDEAKKEIFESLKLLDVTNDSYVLSIID